MAVVYSTSVKAARMQAVLTAIGASGRLEIGTADMGAVLATFTLDATPGVVSGAVLTLSGFPKSDVSADATGQAAAARIRTGAGVDVVTGLTVGTSNADILLGSTALVAGQLVTLSSATITHSA